MQRQQARCQNRRHSRPCGAVRVDMWQGSPSAEEIAERMPLSQLMAQGRPHCPWFGHRAGLRHARLLVQHSASHVGCKCVSENGIARLHSAKRLAVSALRDKKKIKAPATLQHAGPLHLSYTAPSRPLRARCPHASLS